MQKKKADKDRGCCSINFLEYILFIFNFLFYLAGLAVLGIGIWTVFYKSHYTVLLATKVYSITPWILIAAGASTAFVGIFGCVGVVKENRCCLLAYTFMLFAVFFLEAVAGVLAYFYSEHVYNELYSSLEGTFNNEYGENLAVTQAVDELQSKFWCCGALRYDRWSDSIWYRKVNNESLLNERTLVYAPPSCCKSPSENCGRRHHPSNIHYSGCITALAAQVRGHAIIIGAVGLGISIIQVCGMIISCCLYSKLKDYEQTHVNWNRKPKRNGKNSENKPNNYFFDADDPRGALRYQDDSRYYY